mgnify:CR=1 FL=1
MQLYKEKTANYPRLKTDTFFANYSNSYKYSGTVHDAMVFIEEFQLLDRDLWKRFVQQFRDDSDFDAGWRGEFWGKMMRGGCYTYSYTKNAQLYEILKSTVSDMMDSADELGRISTYGVDHEFDGWDIWSRKYVLLGMQYFLEICEDEKFSEKVINSMRSQVDYIISKIGREEEGKKPITLATRHWRGLNSCSILEPVVRLYSLTEEKKYLDFAEYIVSCGGTDIVNIFELAYKNEFYPYQYPVTKAYEMTSCFEGLLEYYRIVGTEWHKTALINFADRILESDFTVIGTAGCSHELFDHSTVRQANTTNYRVMQETCVTVTLMKFFYQLHLLTGNPKYADAFEKSYYNAYLGAINTERVVKMTVWEEHPDVCMEPMPFDSYSPLTAGIRGTAIGGMRIMSDKHYYGCCACIGSLGNGLFPKMQLLTSKKGLVLNLYANGSVKTELPSGGKVTLNIKTDYPKSGKILIEVECDSEEQFELLLRNPEWSKDTSLKINGTSNEVKAGYISLDRVWKSGDKVELELDMTTEAIYPIPYGHDILMNHVVWGHNYMISTYDKEDEIAHRHIALRRGPIMLAQENRLGYSVDEPIDVKVEKKGNVEVKIPETDSAPYRHIVEAKVPLTDGSYMTVTDYASAGKLWNDESKMAVWMLTK